MERSSNTQPQQSKLSIVGKTQRRFARRVSAADLSDKVRARIAELMEFHECSDRAAEAAQKEFPAFRITGKTVTDVMVLPRRKPPMIERAVMPTLRLAGGMR